MSFSNFLRSFSAKNNVFYGLFEQIAENIIQMNKLFIEVINSSDANFRKEVVKKIKDFEHQNDNLTHQVFIELGKNFITPFDREDIHALASALDDVADYIDSSSKKIVLYRLGELDNEIHKLAAINDEAVAEVKLAVYGLRNMNDTAKIKESCIRINGIENRADDIFEFGLVSILENEKEAAMIIKKKDLLQSMEIVTDKCEDVADVIESIIVKYA
jgi:predicted phosphate transport protein (TIGR00153 family)